MTNGDWYRYNMSKMTDHEIARDIEIGLESCRNCPIDGMGFCKVTDGRNCLQTIEAWLKEEHKE